MSCGFCSGVRNFISQVIVKPIKIIAKPKPIKQIQEKPR